MDFTSEILQGGEGFTTRTLQNNNIWHLPLEFLLAQHSTQDGLTCTVAVLDRHQVSPAVWHGLCHERRPASQSGRHASLSGTVSAC